MQIVTVASSQKLVYAYLFFNLTLLHQLLIALCHYQKSIHFHAVFLGTQCLLHLDKFVLYLGYLHQQSFVLVR